MRRCSCDGQRSGLGAVKGLPPARASLNFTSLEHDYATLVHDVHWLVWGCTGIDAESRRGEASLLPCLPRVSGWGTAEVPPVRCAPRDAAEVHARRCTLTFTGHAEQTAIRQHTLLHGSAFIGGGISEARLQLCRRCQTFRP